MSTINLDVMKQLLQEFVEKEALASEEIKVVQQQIEELETRIRACHDKLKVVSEDKQQINAMLQRYAGGMGLASIGAQAPLSSGARPAASVPAQAVGATNLAQALADSKPAPGAKADTASKAGTGKLLDGILSGAGQASESAANNPAPTTPAENPAEAEEGAPKAEETGEETPDDAVKSINDALRGLFR